MVNPNDFIAAARAAMNKNVSLMNTEATYKTNFDEIGKQAVTEAARNSANTAKNNASAARQRIASETDVAITKEAAKRDKDIRGIKKQARMTGLLAGGVALTAGGIALMNKEDEPDEQLKVLEQQKEFWRSQYNKAGGDITAAGERLDEITKKLDGMGGSSDSGGSSSSSDSGGSSNSNSSNSNSSSQYAGLQGGAKTLADAIAKYESGSYGYEAFNQGGSNSGRTVLGKSGNYKNLMGGRSLTDLSLGEIFDKQNTKSKGMSMDEHIKSGGLHAVGRYQFIGSTLQDEVSRMGLSLDTKFTPEIQDKIFLNHIKRVGDISPWVGPSDNYSESEKANFRNIIQGL